MMYGTACRNGCGSFLMGAAAGMLAGAALGATMAPSSRQIKRTAHKAARRVTEAVDHLADAMEAPPPPGNPGAAFYFPQSAPLCRRHLVIIKIIFGDISY